MSDVPLQERFHSLVQDFPGVAGIAAFNLTTGERWGVNEAERFPTASMIKIQVLFELARRCGRGEARMDERLTLRDEDRTKGSGLLVDCLAGLQPTLWDTALLMMAISDNTATNMLIDRLGLDRINAAIEAAGMRDTELRGKIDFARIEESHENLAVGTPRDFCEFNAALLRGILLPAEATAEIIRIMKAQTRMRDTGMSRGLPLTPYAEQFGETPTVTLAAKTGSLTGLRCEAGLIQVTDGPAWSLCVMTKQCPTNLGGVDHPGVRLITDVTRATWDAWGS